MKKILVDAVFTFVDPKGNIFDRLYKMLEDYPNRKIILTNADYKEDNKFNLNNMPYQVFTLKNDPPKTDSKYYKEMLEHFSLKAEEVVYFEHNIDAVQSARAVGIETYHYDKDERDLRKLKKFIDENL